MTRSMRKPWTPEEVRHLRELGRARVGSAAAAEKLGRSRSSVVTKAYLERISLGPAGRGKQEVLMRTVAKKSSQ